MFVVKVLVVGEREVNVILFNSLRSLAALYEADFTAYNTYFVVPGE